MFNRDWTCSACDKEAISLTDWPVGSEYYPNQMALCSDCFDNVGGLSNREAKKLLNCHRVRRGRE